MYGNSGRSGMLRYDTPDCSKVNSKTLEKWIRRGGKFAQLVSQGLERERERSLIKKGESRGREALNQYLDYPRKTDETWKTGADLWSRKNEQRHPGPSTRGSELISLSLTEGWNI